MRDFGERHPALLRFLRPFLLAVALMMFIYGVTHIGDVIRRAQERAPERVREEGLIIPYPRDPDAVILQLFRRSGEADVERRFMEGAPVFTLFGDGRAVFKRIGGYSWRETALTEGEVQLILREARRAGLFSFDVYSVQERLRSGRLSIRDLPSVAIRLNTEQYRAELTLYGLPADMARERRARGLMGFVEMLTRFEERAPGSRPYDPPEIELFVREAEDVEGDVERPPFELRLEEGEAFGDGVILRLGGERAEFFKGMLGAPGSFGYLSIGGRVYRAVFRPVISGERRDGSRSHPAPKGQ